MTTRPALKSPTQMPCTPMEFFTANTEGLNAAQLAELKQSLAEMLVQEGWVMSRQTQKELDTKLEDVRRELDEIKKKMKEMEEEVGRKDIALQTAIERSRILERESSTVQAAEKEELKKAKEENEAVKGRNITLQEDLLKEVKKRDEAEKSNEDLKGKISQLQSLADARKVEIDERDSEIAALKEKEEQAVTTPVDTVQSDTLLSEISNLESLLEAKARIIEAMKEEIRLLEDLRKSKRIKV